MENGSTFFWIWVQNFVISIPKFINLASRFLIERALSWPIFEFFGFWLDHAWSFD
jgi:hypothetical protein